MVARNLRDSGLKLAGVLGCLTLSVGLIVIGPGVIFVLLLWAASERTIYSRVASPDGSREARVQFDDCGAPCGWEKAVFVRSVFIPLDSPVFSCLAFQGSGTSRVRLEWVGKERLLVHHGFGAREYAVPASACGSVAISTRFDTSLVSQEP